MPLDLGFEFVLNTQKHEKSASVLVRFDLSLEVVIDLLDLVLFIIYLDYVARPIMVRLEVERLRQGAGIYWR